MGLLFGAVSGLIFAGIHALATITFRVDHIVSGVVINLVAVGLARFLSQIFFGQATQSDPGQPHLNTVDVPAAVGPAVGARAGLREPVSRRVLRRAVGRPGHVRVVPNALGPSAALGR